MPLPFVGSFENVPNPGVVFQWCTVHIILTSFLCTHYTYIISKLRGEGGRSVIFSNMFFLKPFNACMQVWRIGLLGNNARSENVVAVLKAVGDGLKHMSSSL